MNYTVFRNSNGEVDAINRVEDGATVPFWDAEDPLTQEFEEWRSNNPDFDTSNHPPEPKPSELQLAKVSINAQIDLLRVQKESLFLWTKPAALGQPSQTYPVQSDANSRTNILGAERAAALGLWTSGATWRMQNNVEVPLTSSDLTSLATAMFVHIQKCYRAAFRHKAAIAQLTIVEQVLSYDLTQGWN